MYCRNCGKFIEGERDICDDCLTQLNAQRRPVQPQPIVRVVSVQPAPTPVPQGEPAKTCFGKALASTIMGASSFITAIASFVFLVFAMSALPTGQANVTVNGTPVNADPAISVTMFIFGIVTFLISITLITLTIIFGIQGILAYANAKKANLRRPTASLVLGIIGLSLLFIPIIYSFIDLMLILFYLAV